MIIISQIHPASPPAQIHTLYFSLSVEYKQASKKKPQQNKNKSERGKTNRRNRAKEKGPGTQRDAETHTQIPKEHRGRNRTTSTMV